MKSVFQIAAMPNKIKGNYVSAVPFGWLKWYSIGTGRQAVQFHVLI